MSFLSRLFVVGCIVFGILAPTSVVAETLYGAMVRAYEENPDLIAARAGLRATDEELAIAKAGRRPTLSASASATASDVEGFRDESAEISFSFSQSLFDGFKTKNRILAAQSRIMSGRQTLLSTEMDILIATVQAYVDVLLYQQISSIRRQNLDFLDEQLSASKARLRAGEGTRTDVAQAQASLAAARARLTAAKTNLRAASAVYKQVVGIKPRGLNLPHVPKRVLPKNLDRALSLALAGHPALVSAQYAIDASEYDLRVQQGEFLPGVNLSGSVSEDDAGTSSASISARLSIPIYTGGANSARVRQSHEELTQVQIQLDSVRRSVQQIVTDAWVSYQSSQASINANNSQVRAAQLALSGVVEERKVGQRTTLDVLNAQANVLDARESLTQSQRDLIVAAYNILYTTGQLTVSDLGLTVKTYKPEVHYEAVKDKWFGLRTVTQ